MNEGFLKRLFEQSFMIIILITGLYLIFLEYKSVFIKLDDKNDRDEMFLLQRVEKLNEENKELYERLIDCND